MLASLGSKENPWKVFLLFFFVAFFIRISIFFLFSEASGDGPSRAMLAYMWAKCPVLRPHDAWLPGSIYLSGAFNLVVENPLVSTRLLNLLLGSLTVPIFYLLVKHVFDSKSALVSAAIVTFFPLHVAISVTSLTEVGFLIEVVAGLLLLIKASSEVNSSRRVLFVASCALFVCLALMTRYEAWILIPVFPTYYFLKTRKLGESFIIAAILILFPALWMLSSYYDSGNLLPIYAAAMKGAGQKPETLIATMAIVARHAKNHLGWVIPIAGVLGLLLLIVRALKRDITKEQILYLLVVAIAGLFMLKFALDRGTTLYSRYLLFLFVMILPLAALALVRLFGNYPKLFVALYLLVVASPGITLAFDGSKLPYLKPGATPEEIQRLARWLQRSPYRDDPLLITKMKWKSTKLALYIPKTAFRYQIVSEWREDAYMQDFISAVRPSLLITWDEDEHLVFRVENVLGAEISEKALVYTEGWLKVYDISILTKNYVSDTTPPQRCLLVGPDFQCPCKEFVSVAKP